MTEDKTDVVSFRPKKTNPIGPLVVVPMMGGFRVLDLGNGSIVLPMTFKTKVSAERWIYRQTGSR
jgi:hypothetical protein